MKQCSFNKDLSRVKETGHMIKRDLAPSTGLLVEELREENMIVVPWELSASGPDINLPALA
jgi:hypothetical protein